MHNKNVNNLNSNHIDSKNFSFSQDILFELEKFVTARINIKNIGNIENNVEIVDISDNNSKVEYPQWYKDEKGSGLLIHSSSCCLDLKIKCINDGELNILLLGKDIRDKNGVNAPIFIDFTVFQINGENIIESPILASYEDFYRFTKMVKDSDIITIHIEWKPVNDSSIFKTSISRLKTQINNLNRELELRKGIVEDYNKLILSSIGVKTSDGKITYRNFFRPSAPGFLDNFWFTRYLQHNFPNEEYDINIFSVFGVIDDTITKSMSGKKIFYSPETINKRFPEANKFGRYALDYVDLGMGYDLIDKSNYFRFPYWYFIFDPTVDEEQIENSINYWNSLDYDKSKNVTVIASHDEWKLRTFIANDIEKFTDIDYAGPWRHNNSDLWNKFNNDKLSFLKQYKFNICAENVEDDAYVTEKIFHSIMCNCIPLYAGGGNYLEPNILNDKAILRWNLNEDNSDTVELFKNLLLDEQSYKEFRDQEPFLDNSSKFLIKQFSILEKHFERLIYD
ncbi:glycosyltransferase family 10 domain-containing protein [Methanobrevibacter sp.]|uniref:glycosyltransferase family 10 domain-containing protein n=1 Tax=Methanobrevibacter sp. TaxID=66852 RepID=UPI0025E5B301|nr:glycosyltransferase family 10 [Methanobrevibacter sp.]MBQ2832679.1 hypothetical protein [Methanobrevibacter sp.]